MKFFFILFGCVSYNSMFAQAGYWQQQVNHTIDVTLNDTENTLDGFEKIAYINHSPDTLHFIWFHIWPNAYKNDQTAFSEQLLINNRTDFYFSDKEQRGYINRLDFKVNGVTAGVEDHPEHIDIIKLMLPQPLIPGDSLMISTSFHVKLPDIFSRSGHINQSYLITQWYPKPAVYDHSGWHPMPYLDQGEFYSEFGNYDVRITVPDNYVVAATGELQSPEEITWLKERKDYRLSPTDNILLKKKQSLKKSANVNLVDQVPVSSKKVKTLRYLQNNVHDFAWFADKRFIVDYDTMNLSGRIINVFSFYQASSRSSWKNSVQSIKDAIRTRSAWLGEYPYDVASAVEAQMGFTGGMEYPTITPISSLQTEQDVDETIAHEVSHNWLYGILASNERSFGWMDEGMNTYYDSRYHDWKYKPPATSGTVTRQSHNFFKNRLPDDPETLLFEVMASLHIDQPVNTSSQYFTELNYGLSVYYKAGQWMKKLEDYLGRQMFDSAMHTYYRKWQFKHPYPADFKQILESVSGKKMDSLFTLLNQPGSLERPAKKKVAPAFLFNLKDTRHKHYLSFSPAIGGNSYDGFMMGAVLHNYQLPPGKLSFIVMPLYATGSNKLNGLAKAAYSWYPEKRYYRIDAGLNASRFSMNSFLPEQRSKLYPGFIKLVPYFRITLNEQDPLSKREQFVQVKSFVVREQALQFKQVVNGPDTQNVVNLIAQTRNLLQVKYVVSNTRELYPYTAEFALEQQNGFVRLGFTGNYYFNFANRQSGMNLRFFAGKFFYTGAKTLMKQFQTDRYQLNLSGASGYEDYTYGNYFAGRNEFEGWSSRQLMIRDGGFKVRTDLLSSKVGKSDNWLTAINLSTDIPKNINPLQVLPFKLPVKVFADIGTFAEAWQQDAASTRFLFDAGFQLSLFKEILNMYIPVVYSTVYKDYFRSTLGSKRFWKTVSFSIDLQKLSLKKVDKNIPFNSLFH